LGRGALVDRQSRLENPSSETSLLPMIFDLRSPHPSRSNHMAGRGTSPLGGCCGESAQHRYGSARPIESATRHVQSVACHILQRRAALATRRVRVVAMALHRHARLIFSAEFRRQSAVVLRCYRLVAQRLRRHGLAFPAMSRHPNLMAVFCMANPLYNSCAISS